MKQDLKLLRGKSIVVFDIDGTLANLDHRVHLLPDGLFADYQLKDVDWEHYNNLCDQDEPIPMTMSLLQRLLQYSFENNQLRIVFFTGRNDFARKKTLRWFSEHGVNIPLSRQFVFMRPDGSAETNVNLKNQWLREIQDAGGNVIYAFDDDPAVCRMFRKHGVICYRVDSKAPSGRVLKDVRV